MFCVLFAVQPVAQPGGVPGALQELHEVILQVFDKDHSGAVTASEVDVTLSAFGAMAGGMGEPGNPNEIETMIASAKEFAPQLVQLLDADGSSSLSKSELLWISKFQTVLKNGELRNLTRDVFVALDADGDDALTADEAKTDDALTLAKVVTLVQEVLPLPSLMVDTADAEQRATLRKHLSRALELLDADGDGVVVRKEAGAAFKKFRGMFLKAAKTLREMGPMLAMFGMDGARGMGGAGNFRVPGQGKGGAPNRPKPTKHEL